MQMDLQITKSKESSKRSVSSQISVEFMQFDIMATLNGKRAHPRSFNNTNLMISEEQRSIPSINKSNHTENLEASESKKQLQRQNKKMMTKSNPKDTIPVFPGYLSQQMMDQEQPQYINIPEIVPQKPKLTYESGSNHGCYTRRKNQHQVCHTCQPTSSICNKKCHSVCFAAFIQRSQAAQKTMIEEESSQKSYPSTKFIDQVLQLNQNQVDQKVPAEKKKHLGPCGCQKEGCTVRNCNCLRQNRACTQHCRCVHAQCKNFYRVVEKKEIVPVSTLLSSGPSDNGSIKSSGEFLGVQFY